MHDDPFSGSLDLDAVTVSQARGVVGTPIPGLEWAQESDTVTLYVALAAGARGRDLAVKITVEALSVTPKRGGPHDRTALGLPDGATTLLSGKLGGRCKPDESEWTIEAGELVITLRKALQREWAHAIDPTSWTRAQHSTPAAAAGETTGGSGGTSRAASGERPRPSAPPFGTERQTSAPAPRPPTPELPNLPLPNALDAAAAAKSDGGGAAVAAGRLLGSGSTGGRLREEYAAWDKFDDVGALMQAENEGNEAYKDEPEWTLRTGPGGAGMQCSKYVKDKEEVARSTEGPWPGARPDPAPPPDDPPPPPPLPPAPTPDPDRTRRGAQDEPHVAAVQFQRERA